MMDGDRDPLRRRVLGGLLAAAALPLAGCGIAARQFERLQDRAAHGAEFGRSGRLAADELQWARIAWRYFEGNTDSTTGLVNGRDRRPTTSMWNLADYLAALVAAGELGVVSQRDFDLRMSRALGFLGSMDLSGGLVPGRTYNVATGKMVNFENRPEDTGWSALDVGRLMAWMRIVGQRHPRFQEYVDKALLRWSFCRVIDDCGALHGANRKQGQVNLHREGRFGYEQLAAAGFATWGFDASASSSLPPLEYFNVMGTPVPFDARDPRVTGVPAPTLTMPHVYLGMEYGWVPPGTAAAPALRAIADRVYEVQRERWRRDKALTARTDYQSPDAPFVVLDSVYAAGYPFNTVGVDNKPYEKLALVSTRAAFGMWALWPDDYTDRLIEAVRHLHDPDRGWFEGRLEATGGPLPHVTLATNADVLRSLLFKAKGPLATSQPNPGFYQRQLSDPFKRTDQCLPHERPACRQRAG